MNNAIVNAQQENAEALRNKQAELAKLTEERDAVLQKGNTSFETLTSYGALYFIGLHSEDTTWLLPYAEYEKGRRSMIQPHAHGWDAVRLDNCSKLTDIHFEKKAFVLSQKVTYPVAGKVFGRLFAAGGHNLSVHRTMEEARQFALTHCVKTPDRIFGPHFAQYPLSNTKNPHGWHDYTIPSLAPKEVHTAKARLPALWQRYNDLKQDVFATKDSVSQLSERQTFLGTDLPLAIIHLETSTKPSARAMSASAFIANKSFEYHRVTLRLDGSQALSVKASPEDFPLLPGVPVTVKSSQRDNSFCFYLGESPLDAEAFARDHADSVTYG